MPGPPDNWSGGGGGVVAAALVAFALVMLRRWRRNASAESTPTAPRRSERRGAAIDIGLVALGLLLAVGGVFVGRDKLDTKDRPTATARYVGVVPPSNPKLGRGFALGMSIEVDGCDGPVKVTLVTAGTAEFWRDYRKHRPASGRFRLAIPDKHLIDPNVHLGTGVTDVTGPRYVNLQERSRDLTVREPRIAFDVTVLEGAIRKWHQSLVPVIAKFKADWLRSRGQGTCYLVFPGLAGPDSVTSAEQARGRASYNRRHTFGHDVELVSTDPHTGLTTPVEPEYEPTHGATTVVVRDGQVVTDASLPPPDANFDGYPVWTCKTTPRSYRTLKRSGPLPSIATLPTAHAAGGAFSKRGLESEHTGGCAGAARSAESGAVNQRDLVLILMGAAISLGLAIIVEVLLDWRRGGVPLWRRRARTPA